MTRRIRAKLELGYPLTNAEREYLLVCWETVEYLQLHLPTFLGEIQDKAVDEIRRDDSGSVKFPPRPRRRRTGDSE